MSLTIDSERSVSTVLMRLTMEPRSWDGAGGHTYWCDFSKLLLKTIFRIFSSMSFSIEGKGLRDHWSLADESQYTLEHIQMHVTRKPLIMALSYAPELKSPFCDDDQIIRMFNTWRLAAENDGLTAHNWMQLPIDHSVLLLNSNFSIFKTWNCFQSE